MIASLALLLLAVPAQSTDFPYQRFVAVEGSRVGYRGESTLHDFGGEARRVTAYLHADLARLATTAGGEVRFSVADLDSGNGDRDENMRADLDVAHFPEIAFRLDRLEGTTAASGESTLASSGSFEIRGVARARSFTTRLELLPAGRLAVRGELRFLQTDHGIEPHSTFGVVKVHDEVEVWFDLRLEPVAATLREGSARAVRVEEITRIPGSAPQSATADWRLWTAPEGALLDGGAEWWLAQGAAGARLDPRAGVSLAAAPDAEQDFAAARERLATLEARLAGLSAEQRARAGAKLTETIERLRETLAAAPAAGPATLRRDGDEVEILLGDRVWVRLEGLAGEEPLPAALAALPNLPAGVREALRGLRGVPARAMLLTASTSGEREYRLAIAAPAPCRIPAWALDPAQWPASGTP